MEDKFDKKITKMLNEDIYIPHKITNRIKTSLKEEKKGVWSNMKLNKIVATMAIIVIIGTSVVFAGKAFIERKNSTEIAKDYGYFEKVDMDYVNNAGLGIKIENYFIDQDRVGFTVNIKSDEEIDAVEIYSTALTGNNTYSETIDGKTYIHWDESEVGLEYNRRFDLIKYIDEDGNEIKYKDINGFGAELGKYEYLGNNVIRALYTAPVGEEVTASKMKVVIKRVVINNDGNKKEYIGDWEFEINIADKYLDKSRNIKYKGTVNLENLVVEKAVLSATKLIVTIKSEDLQKLLYGTEDNKDMLYGRPELFGAEGQYNHEEINTQTSCDYDNNEMTFKFDISKFNSENSYKIISPVLNGNSSEMVIMLSK